MNDSRGTLSRRLRFALAAWEQDWWRNMLEQAQKTETRAQKSFVT